MNQIGFPPTSFPEIRVSDAAAVQRLDYALVKVIAMVPGYYATVEGSGRIRSEDLIPGYDNLKEIFSNLDTHVFRARSGASGELVIIKIKRNGVFPDNERNGIVNEAHTYRKLDHPNCPRLIEYREEKDF